MQLLRIGEEEKDSEEEGLPPQIPLFQVWHLPNCMQRTTFSSREL